MVWGVSTDPDRSYVSFHKKIFPFEVNLPFYNNNKSRTTSPISEFAFRFFYIYYTELSRIANGDMLDLFFITQQQGIFEHLSS